MRACEREELSGRWEAKQQKDKQTRSGNKQGFTLRMDTKCYKKRDIGKFGEQKVRN